ncbi:MAG: patatin-like phospholipase family protein [Planctomycetes bacterium]|nr:patatin-like phospholipase family protein [Planctomycetota bacterium]
MSTEDFTAQNIRPEGRDPPGSRGVPGSEAPRAEMGDSSERLRAWTEKLGPALSVGEKAGQSGHGIGLAFSGGGFRATLFHLGVVQAFRDAQLLSTVRVISSVSGGSVLAAHMVLNWGRYCGTDEEFRSVSAELLEFVRSNPRATVVAHAPLASMLHAACSLLRFLRFERGAGALERRWPTTNIHRMAALYDNALFRKKTLADLDPTIELRAQLRRPHLRILTCNLTKIGANSYFDYQGYHADITPGDPAAPCSLLKIGVAVAASSAFPLLFEPLQVTPDYLSVRRDDMAPTYQVLTDGGVFDNLGLHRLLEDDRVLASKGLPLRQIVVSNAGGALDLDDRSSFRRFVGRLARVSEVLYKQVAELHSSHLRSGSRSISIDIRDIVCHAWLPDQAQRKLEFVRTDFDRFSDAEIAALISHGRAVGHSRLGFPGCVAGDLVKAPDIAPSEMLDLLDRSSGKTLGIVDIARHWVVIVYLSIVAVGMWGVWKVAISLGSEVLWLEHGVQVDSIKEFLVPPHDAFFEESDDCSKNMYFVGLVNQFTLTNHAGSLANAVRRKVSINFLLYLPQRRSDGGAVSPGLASEYATVFRRYRPHGNDWIPALKKFWKEMDVNGSVLQGRATEPPSVEDMRQNFHQWFYDDTPKGWLVVFDMDFERLTARSVYWFPYLSQASEIDRPGARLSPSSALGQAALRWLDYLCKDAGTRPATPAIVDPWREAIEDLPGPK